MDCRRLPIRRNEGYAHRVSATALGVGEPRRIPAALAGLFAGRHAIAAVTRSARSSNAHIKRELGWTPRFPTAAHGVPDAIAQLT